jgi:hypothetical protein
MTPKQMTDLADDIRKLHAQWQREGWATTWAARMELETRTWRAQREHPNEPRLSGLSDLLKEMSYEPK